MKRELRVVEMTTRKVIHKIDVSGKNDRQVEMVLRGMLRNMGHETQSTRLIAERGPCAVWTWMGPSSLITFEIWVLSTHPSETRHVGEMEVREMLLFAQENGLGADRSQGMGKFDVVNFEVVQKAERKAAKEEKPAKEEKTKTA